MIGKGSEAIQRHQQRQQSTKRWSGMDAWNAMVNGNGSGSGPWSFHSKMQSFRFLNGGKLIL
jgi:hypothetical protein